MLDTDSFFIAAINIEEVVARAIGLVILILTGAGLLLVGISNQTVLDILFGIIGLGAAAYSWWYTRN